MHGIQQVTGSGYVSPEQIIKGAVVQSGKVNNAIRAHFCNNLLHTLIIQNVTRHKPDLSITVGILRKGPHNSADIPFTNSEEVPDLCSAREAGRARDQDLHGRNRSLYRSNSSIERA